MQIRAENIIIPIWKRGGHDTVWLHVLMCSGLSVHIYLLRSDWTFLNLLYFFPSVHPWPRIAFSSWLLLSDSSRTSCCDAHSVRSSNRPPPKILPSVPGVSMALSLPHRLIVNPSLHLSGLWSFIPFKLQLMMNGRTSLGLKPRSLCGIAR